MPEGGYPQYEDTATPKKRDGGGDPYMDMARRLTEMYGSAKQNISASAELLASRLAALGAQTDRDALASAKEMRALHADSERSLAQEMARRQQELTARGGPGTELARTYQAERGARSAENERRQGVSRELYNLMAESGRQAARSGMTSATNSLNDLELMYLAKQAEIDAARAAAASSGADVPSSKEGYLDMLSALAGGAGALDTINAEPGYDMFFDAMDSNNPKNSVGDQTYMRLINRLQSNLTTPEDELQNLLNWQEGDPALGVRHVDLQRLLTEFAPEWERQQRKNDFFDFMGAR